MKRLLFILILFSAFLTEFAHASEDYQNFLDITSRYIGWMNRYGSANEGSSEEMARLFAPTFSVSLNDKFSRETLQSFSECMEKARDHLGGWYVHSLNFSVSPYTRSATLYCLCNTPTNQIYLAFMMLHFNELDQITELTIVYTLCTGGEDLVHIY